MFHSAGKRDLNMLVLRNPQFLLLSSLGLLAAVHPAAAARVHSVIELFTSQGCSSCPPADKILGELARNPDILAVSLPIDYWDYIGWRDTLASPLFTARQKAYAAGSGHDQVYTPQAIVDGLADVVGSDAAAIEKAARESLGTDGVMAVPLDVSVSGATIDVSIGEASPGAPTQAGVYLLALTRTKSVKVERGENAGATLTYANVVRAIIKIGEWDGKKLSLSADEALAHVDGADSFAVVLQTGGRAQPGAMLAAWGS
jgi:hypothetical protein